MQRDVFEWVRFQEANISFTDQDIEFVKDLIDPDKDALRDAHQSNTIVDRHPLASQERLHTYLSDLDEAVSFL